MKWLGKLLGKAVDEPVITQITRVCDDCVHFTTNITECRKCALNIIPPRVSCKRKRSLNVAMGVSDEEPTT